MEHDNFSLQYCGGKIWYFHKDLKKLIDFVTAKEKEELENYCKEISEIFGREIKLTWGFERAGDTIENVLSHVSSNRQDFDLMEPDCIEQGHLSYQEHNLTNDMVKAPVYSIVIRYISLLNKQAVKIKNLQ